MVDLRIVDAPEIPTEDITGQEKLPTGGGGNYSITLDSVADYTKNKKDLADNTSVDGKVNGVRQELDAHIEDLLNPHQVTKAQIGLGNVDNTADADKPVSNSTQAAIISAVAPKADKTYVDNQLTLKANKSDVDSSLLTKADRTYVDNQLAVKSDKTYVDSSLLTKADRTYTDSQLYLKADKTYVDSQDLTLQSQIDQKATAEYLDNALTEQTNTVNTALSNLSTVASKFYPTLAEANTDIANIAVNQPVTVGEVDNGGLWYKATVGATSLTKSPYDSLTQSKLYVDSFDSLTINAKKDYPLKKLTRNGITSQASNINDAILDIQVFNAVQGKVYKLEFYANGGVDTANLVTENSWRFTEYDELTFPSTTGTTGGILVVTSGMPQIEIDRTKTNTYTIKSTTHPVYFNVTIDGTKLKSYGTAYSLMNSSGAGWSFVIDKSCYVYTDDAVVNDINKLKAVVDKPIFPTESPILSTSYISKDAIEIVEFWGLEDDESVYLRTLWNYYFNTNSSKYFSSIGFNSSKNQHIAIALAPQSSYSQYSQFEVAEKLTATVEYLLYRDGDASTEPVGRVIVDWSKINNSTSQRFIKTDNSNPLIMPNVVNKASQQVLQIAKSITPESSFFGKKIGAIGDSITWGFTPRNDPNGGTTGVQLNSWLVLAAQKLGMTAFNYGISGSTLGANSAGANAPFSRRYQNMANDLDVICVMGGTNDVRKGVPIGTMSDRVDTTYYGALHVICQGLIDKYYINQGTELGKSKQIVLMTPIKLQVGGGTALDTSIEPYVQAVKEVGAYYSVPVLDMYNLSGITPHISQTVQGTEAGYTQTYNVYITDGTHPTQQGHKKMASAFSGFLKTLE